MGTCVVGKELSRMIVNEWLDGVYEGGRHQQRVDLIKDIEGRQ
jgi:ribose 5-phosphate isomerase B